MSEHPELAALRRELDVIDAEILSALNRRFAVTDRVRELKRRENLPRVDAKREAEILAKVCASVPSAHRDTVCAVYERILGGSRGFVETIARGICVRNGEVLLCRAKSGETAYLPGGHIEFGETGAAALAREMREEAGVDVTVGRFLGAVENDFLQHGKRHCEINLVYEMTVAEGEVSSREDWIGFEWRKTDDLGCLVPASMRGLVAKA